MGNKESHDRKFVAKSDFGYELDQQTEAKEHKELLEVSRRLNFEMMQAMRNSPFDKIKPLTHRDEVLDPNYRGILYRESNTKEAKFQQFMQRTPEVFYEDLAFIKPRLEFEFARDEYQGIRLKWELNEEALLNHTTNNKYDPKLLSYEGMKGRIEDQLIILNSNVFALSRLESIAALHEIKEGKEGVSPDPEGWKLFEQSEINHTITETERLVTRLGNADSFLNLRDDVKLETHPKEKWPQLKALRESARGNPEKLEANPKVILEDLTEHLGLGFQLLDSSLQVSALNNSILIYDHEGHELAGVILRDDPSGNPLEFNIDVESPEGKTLPLPSSKSGTKTFSVHEYMRIPNTEWAKDILNIAKRNIGFKKDAVAA